MMRRLGTNLRYDPPLPPAQAPPQAPAPSKLNGTPSSSSIGGGAVDSYSDTLSRKSASFRELDLSDPVDDRNSTSSGSSPDSGISTTADNSTDAVIGQAELTQLTGQLCQQLIAIVRLTIDFNRDVTSDGNESSANDLLDEFRHKMQPFVVSIDEQMTSTERLLRASIDRSTIADHQRIGHLLQSHRYLSEMRRVLVALSGTVFEDLERVLALRARGCIGLTSASDTADNLREMAFGLARADQLIRADQQQQQPKSTKTLTRCVSETAKV